MNLVYFQRWYYLFQCTLLVEIRALVARLKSTLLLKIKCFGTHIYTKTQYLQTNNTQHYLGKENAQEQVEQEIELALTKSLI